MKPNKQQLQREFKESLHLYKETGNQIFKTNLENIQKKLKEMEE